MATADKLFHLGTCYTIALSFGFIFSPLVGLTVAMCAGIGKEAFDMSCGGIFDWLDIAADAAGAGLAVAVFAIPTL